VQLKAGYARLKLVYRDGAWVDSRAFDTADKEVLLAVVVRAVKRESEAEALGLKKGDVLLAYSGSRVRSVAWLRAQQGPPGKDAVPGELEVQRGQKRFKVKAEPGKIDAEIEDVARSIALPR
jgi:S1-C subfamily serine protease